MATFRGMVQGNRGQSTRLGTANSGLQVEAQSWRGKVEVFLKTGRRADSIVWSVYINKHEGAGPSRQLIAEGEFK